jgi:hypothetical protein
MIRVRAMPRWIARHHTVLIWILAFAALASAMPLLSVSQMQALGDQVVIPAGFWAGAFFIIYYSSLARWWANPVGRMVVQLDFAFMLVTGGTTFAEEFGLVFSSVTEIRILFSGLVVAAFTIISRVFLVGSLNGWRPHLPWRLGKKTDGPD